MSRARRAWLALGLLAALPALSTHPARAAAPTVEAPAPAASSGPPRTPLEAEVQGYQRRPETEPAGSFLGGLLAFGPGFFVHGVGHYYVDDRPTAWKLLLGEVLGLGLVGAGAILQATTEDSGALVPVRRALIHGGVLLFLGTWVTDVVGSFKGAESFDRDTSRTQGRVLQLAYRYRGDERNPRHHFLVAGLDLDAGAVYARPEALLESNLDERDLRLDLGGRVWRGKNEQNHVALGLRGRRLDVPAEAFAVRSGELYVAWKADLGVTIPSMRGFYLTHRVGVGYEQYQFGHRLGSTPGVLDPADFGQSFVTLASGVEVNTGRRTHVGLRFIQDPTAEVVSSSAETGVVQLLLTHQYRDDLEMAGRLTAGDGVAFWLGLGYGL